MDIKEIKKIVKNITFAPSNLDMGWKWQVKEIDGGFKIRTSFKRPDTNSGKFGTGYGRWMFVDKNADDRGVVMTAWVCAKLIVEHELMEAFLYKKVRILDPHKSLEALAYPHTFNATHQVIKEAMKAVSKDVRAPKVVRDGLVKKAKN